MANNVIKRVWNQNRMVAIEDLKGMTFQAESGGHTFQISGVDDAGNTVALSGSVSGVFLRPDNTDVSITGSASGGVVSVTLLPECYDVPGRFGLTVFVTDNGQKTAVYAAMGTVSRTSSGAVSPGTTSNVVDLINQINAAVATIPASWTGLMADIAPTYSDTAVYPVGAYCYYNGDLYRCTTAITTAESWSAGHWTQAVLGNDVSDLKSAILTKERNVDGELFGTGDVIYDLVPGMLSGTLKWSLANNPQHIVIPINSGDSIVIGANSNNKAYYVWLEDDTVKDGETADAVDGTQRNEIVAGGSNTVTAPANSKYLYVLATYNNTNYYPRLLTINGIDRLVSISEKIGQIDNKTENIQTVLTDSNGKFNQIVNVGSIVPFSVTTKKTLNRTGEVVNSSYSTSYVTSDIPVVTGDIYYLEIVALYSGNHLSYAIYNAQDELIYGLNHYDEGITENTRVYNTVRIPENASYMRVSGYNYQGTGNPIVKKMGQLTNYIRESAVFVSPSGNDGNDGATASTALRTIQTAVDRNPQNVVVMPGDYSGQTVNITGKHGMNIVCIPKSTHDSYLEPFKKAGKACLDNSIDVTGLEAYGTIFRTSLTLAETSRYYKVFISKELAVNYTSAEYYGDIDTYNAILWELPGDISQCKQMLPVLTESDCISTEGSFYYDGSYLYIHPTGNTLTGKTYKRLLMEYSATGSESSLVAISISNSDNIHICGFDVSFFPFWSIRIIDSSSVVIENSSISFSNYRHGNYLDKSDATYKQCLSAFVGGDGWNANTCGNLSLIDCNALYCADDGVSHHGGTNGIIKGGTYKGNQKGGITPAFGAIVNIDGAVCVQNAYGVMFTANNKAQVSGAVCSVNGVLSVNNAEYDIEARGYDLILHGSQYGTKHTMYDGTIAEYGNTVIV